MSVVGSLPRSRCCAAVLLFKRCCGMEHMVSTVPLVRAYMYLAAILALELMYLDILQVNRGGAGQPLMVFKMGSIWQTCVGLRAVNGGR